MRLRLSIKIPSSSNGVVSSKVSRAAGRALSIARGRIVPLVVDRAQALVTKEAPAMVNRYVKALAAPNAVVVTDKDVTINITDPLVLGVERGTKAFDLKAKLLAHATKSSKKGGPYIDVPFTHKAGTVPTKIRAAASRAAKSAGGAAEVRLSMKTEGKSFTRQLQRGRIGQALGLKAKKQEVKHKRGVHDDMIRSSASKGGGGRSSVSYTTIRRVSMRSSSTAWWHPGFKAARVLDKVLPSVKRDISSIIRDAFFVVRSGT